MQESETKILVVGAGRWANTSGIIESFREEKVIITIPSVSSYVSDESITTGDYDMDTCDYRELEEAVIRGGETGIALKLALESLKEREEEEEIIPVNKKKKRMSRMEKARMYGGK